MVQQTSASSSLPFLPFGSILGTIPAVLQLAIERCTYALERNLFHFGFQTAWESACRSSVMFEVVAVARAHEYREVCDPSMRFDWADLQPLVGDEGISHQDIDKRDYFFTSSSFIPCQINLFS